MPDYIIVGGGSSGCAIAARLSEDPDTTVELLEAGPRDRSPFVHLPACFYKVSSGGLTWGLKTAPMRHADGRELDYRQGRVLGGGSSINAQVFTRGCPEDYDGWATEDGCAGWSFADVLPYFTRSESNEILSGFLHGNDGPLGVDNAPPQLLTRSFLRAGQQFGLPYNPDFNGARQEGVGIYQATIRSGRRCSAAVAYLRPSRGRRNLRVRTDAVVTRLLFEKRRAIGVEVSVGGRIETIVADREVIVAAGAIWSPKLLMLSGVGPADALRGFGIDVVQDLPGVGLNLQDHMVVDVVCAVREGRSVDKYKKPHWKLHAALEWLLYGRGPVASNIVEAGAFWWSDRDETTPDLQFHFLPGVGTEAGRGMARGSGATLNSYHLRPRSRGTVRLRSADPRDPPEIDPNSFADPYDLDRAVDGVKISREILRQPSFRDLVVSEHLPGRDVRSDEEHRAFVRRTAYSASHPVGTCRMGSDSTAVVDTELRVGGIEGLRVCDSSVMPRLISSNTNAAAIMIGEKASDLIRNGGRRSVAVA